VSLNLVERIFFLCIKFDCLVVFLFFEVCCKGLVFLGFAFLYHFVFYLEHLKQKRSIKNGKLENDQKTLVPKRLSYECNICIVKLLKNLLEYALFTLSLE